MNYKVFLPYFVHQLKNFCKFTKTNHKWHKSQCNLEEKSVENEAQWNMFLSLFFFFSLIFILNGVGVGVWVCGVGWGGVGGGVEGVGCSSRTKKSQTLGLHSPTNIIQFYQTDLVFFFKLVVRQGKAV